MHLEGVKLVVRMERGVIAGHVVGFEDRGVADVRVLAAGVQGQEVPGFSAWQDLPAAITDADGAFALRDLAGGSYALRAVAGDGSEAHSPPISTGRQDVVLRLGAPGRIEGELVGFSSTPDVLAIRQDRSSPTVRGTVHGMSFALDGLAPAHYVLTALAEADGATQSVTVEPGQVKRVVLTSGGGTRLTGRVVEIRTGEPVPNLRCRLAPWVGSSAAPVTFPGEAWTNDKGEFELGRVPRGSAYLFCQGTGGVTDGITRVELQEGPAAATVGVIKQRGPLALLGAKPDGADALVFRVAYVRPGQPAEQAGMQVGDVVVSVDGMDVRPFGEAAVEMLMRDRPAGSVARLGLLRGGAEVVADLKVGKWQ